MKRKKIPSLVTLAIMTTITILAWVGYSVYKVFISKPDPDVPPEILAPIKTDLDIKILEEIKERVYFERGEAGEFVTEVSPQDVVVLPVEEEEVESSESTTSTLEKTQVAPSLSTPEEATRAGELET